VVISHDNRYFAVADQLVFLENGCVVPPATEVPATTAIVAS
jgi:ABC-type siderophore export system fused ATPase/permease subunit